MCAALFSLKREGLTGCSILGDMMVLSKFGIAYEWRRAAP
jgi:hypothetical protein